MAETRGSQNSVALVNEFTEQVEGLRTRVKFKTSLMIFIIALLVMVTATLAWFTVSGLAGTDGLDLNCTTGSDLRIATSNRGNDINAYERKITSEMVDAQLKQNSYKPLADIKLAPLSTRNASSNIGTRLFLQNGTEMTENGPKNGNYLLFNVWLISSSDTTVYLSDKESESGAADGTKITSAKTNTGSQGDVVKAARISFEPAGEGTRIYEVESRPYASNQTNAFSSISGQTDANKLCTLSANTPKQVTIRVWIEGEDPLCVDRIQSSSFSIQLMFEGEKKDQQ